MAAPTAARRAALATLGAVRSGELAGRAFETASGGLDARDRAWAQELAYGALRLRGRLDHRLAALSRRPLDRLDPDILDILRLGAYQLTEMDGVPAYAAVSQSVELAKDGGGRGAAGFVNGVLQSLRRAGNTSTFPDFAADAVAHLSTWGSHPRWLVERWIGRWGVAATRRLVEANNTRPELYLRALGDVEDVMRRLAEAGVDVARVPEASGVLHMQAGTVAAALAAAPVIVQDPAAGLVVSYAGAMDGLVVADLAAAPGGKALALATDAAFVAASDISVGRLGRARQNLDRLKAFGPVPLALMVADGRQPALKPVDVVLLDAPCTGTGTLRRHPDGRWRIQPRDLAALVRLQADLLDAAATLVRPGGLLLYSTCSLEREENEDQVQAFVARERRFEVEPGPVEPGPLAGGVVRQDGMLEVLPHEHGWDGAFAARLRRRG